MKPLRTRLQEARKRLSLPWEVLERDYLLSWILAGIGRVDSLRETLVFKGGTALKKCYFGDYRFSEDLDFSGVEGVPTGDAMERAVRDACAAASKLLDEYAPVEIACERYTEKDPHPGGQAYGSSNGDSQIQKRLEKDSVEGGRCVECDSQVGVAAPGRPSTVSRVRCRVRWDVWMTSRRKTMTGRTKKASSRSRRVSPSDPSCPSDAKLDEMIEEAIVDAYGASERIVGFYTMLEDNLATPFKTEMLGIEVTVERVDVSDDEQIAAVCSRGKSRQRVPILDLPLPDPAPEGAEWIMAFRRWSRGGR